MANELTTPPPGDPADFCPDDAKGRALSTLGEVRRELGRLYRLLKQGHVEPKRGGVMANVLATLAKSMEAADLAQFSDEEIIAEMRRRRDLRVDADAEH